MKSCIHCPFVNLEYWGIQSLKDVEAVIDEYVTRGELKDGEPQVCHMKLKRGDDDKIGPASSDEVCIGHLNYLRNR